MIRKAAGKAESIDITEWFSVEPKGNTFVITLKGAEELAEGQQAFAWEKGYTYTAVLKGYYGASEPASATMKLNIKASTKQPTVSFAVKAAGSIDVLRPETTAITITPTVKNWFDYDLDDAEIVFSAKNGKAQVPDDELGDPFDVAARDGALVITAKPGAEINHSWKYTATVKLPTLPLTETGYTKTVALKIGQGSAKINPSVKAVDLLKRDKYSSAKIKLVPTDTQLSIDRAELDANSGQLYKLERLSDDTWVLSYLDHAYRNQKSGTVKLNVFLNGNQTEKANAVLSVKVNIK